MRSIILVALVACDSGAKPPSAPPPPITAGDAKPVDAARDAFDEDLLIPFPKETLGWLEGTVVDAKTHEHVWGATVTPVMPSGDWATFDNSDRESGHYRIRIPEGKYRVTFSYPGNDQERKGVVVNRGQTTTLDWTVPHRAVVSEQAVDARRERDNATCPPMKGTEELASVTDVPALAGSVLSYYAAHPNEMMDWSEQLPKDGDIFVVDEVPIEGTVLRLTTASLRGFAPTQFVIKTRAAIQAESDRINGKVGYLSFGAIALDGTCARVHLGLMLMVPRARQDGRGTECCTSVEDLLQKHGTTWSMVARRATVMY